MEERNDLPILLTEQHLFDYINCPILFNLKYVKHIPVEEKITIKSLIERTGKSLFTYLYMGRTPTLEMLKKKWDIVCDEYQGTIAKDKLINGMRMLQKMFLWAANQEVRVLEMDAKYTVSLPGIEMSGLSGLIVGDNNKQELLVMDYSDRESDQLFVDLKLKYSLDAYVFYKVYGKILSGIKVHNVKNDKDFLSIRSKDDYTRVESTIINVAKAVKAGIYYPREIGCHFCNATNYCKGWSK